MKAVCSPGYHHNGSVVTQAIGHMMSGFTLLVPMSQSVLNKLSTECTRSGHKWSTTRRLLKSHRRKIGLICIQSWKQSAFWSKLIYNTHSVEISQNVDVRNVYAIRKTNCPPDCHRNDSVATHAIQHMMSDSTLLVPMSPRVLKKLRKKRNISCHKWSTTGGCNMYVIITVLETFLIMWNNEMKKIVIN